MNSKSLVKVFAATIVFATGCKSRGFSNSGDSAAYSGSDSSNDSVTGIKCDLDSDVFSQMEVVYWPKTGKFTTIVRREKGGTSLNFDANVIFNHPTKNITVFNLATPQMGEGKAKQEFVNRISSEDQSLSQRLMSSSFILARDSKSPRAYRAVNMVTTENILPVGKCEEISEPWAPWQQTSYKVDEAFVGKTCNLGNVRIEVTKAELWNGVRSNTKRDNFDEAMGLDKPFYLKDLWIPTRYTIKVTESSENPPILAWGYWDPYLNLMRFRVYETSESQQKMQKDFKMKLLNPKSASESEVECEHAEFQKGETL